MNATHQQNMSAFYILSSIFFQEEYNSSSEFTSEVYTSEFLSCFFSVASEPRIATIFLLPCCLPEDLERLGKKTWFLQDPEQLQGDACPSIK